MSSNKRIYLDYAATTPLDPRVERVMLPFLRERFGNPSSIHAEGVAAKKALDAAHRTVARCLEAHTDEIVFTSGGTEANNLAIFGVIDALFSSAPLQRGSPSVFRVEGVRRRGSSTPLNPPSKEGGRKSAPHIVTTNIEPSSVLEPLRELERQGRAEITYVPVEQNGIVKPEKIIAAIKPSTVLVSVMYANNEIGTIQPIRKIGQMIHDSRFMIHESPHEKRYPVFHADACQSPLYLNCLVNALGVDLLTLDAHKIYGPKGVGALYVRRGIPLVPQILGGGQERGLRSTTENVAGIGGFTEALRIAPLERERESERVGKLRDQLYADVLKNISIPVLVNGSMEKGERLPNNLNISLPGTDTEFLTLQLDAAGIAVSTRSSCLKDEKKSYVVGALGGGKYRAASTLRFTLGRWTTKKDTEYAAKTLTHLAVSKH